jgi:agmatinase
VIESIIGAVYDEADAVVIGVPYEHTASFGTGALDGPEKIKTVLDEQLELFDRYTHTNPAELYKFAYKEIKEVKKYAPEHMVDHLSKVLEAERRFYVLLGGVHSVSIPSLKSLATKVDPSEVTVVQIDAHFDLRDDDSEYNEVSPSKFAHSTVMRRAHEYGYNLLPVGIRTMFKDEYDFAKENNIQYFEWGRADVKTPTVEEVVKAITTEKVYLTIDVDGFSPRVMPATGTPVPGGLSWEYGEDLIRAIMKQKTVLAADIVEVAPVKHSGQTEYNAAQLVYHILSIHMQNKN